MQTSLNTGFGETTLKDVVDACIKAANAVRENPFPLRFRCNSRTHGALKILRKPKASSRDREFRSIGDAPIVIDETIQDWLLAADMSDGGVSVFQFIDQVKGAT